MTQSRSARSPAAAVALIGAGLVLAGCAGTPGDAPPPDATSPTASAPAPTPGYDWFFHADGDEAKLAYGVESSDDLRLGLTCLRGQSALELSAAAAQGADDLYLESGGETERFPAEAEPSELHDGVFLTAQADTRLPVFQRFRTLGWLALWRADRRETLVPHPGSKSGVEDFFAFCG